MLTIKHIELAQANEFVTLHHRHHKPVRGHRFSVGCFDGDRLCGVAIVGRPVARMLDPCSIVEVLRLCTDGTRNACSILYAACRRAARELGYSRIITYILDSEPGTSLVASGWRYVREAGGGSWSRAERPRENNAPTCKKQLWAARLKEVG